MASIPITGMDTPKGREAEMAYRRAVALLDLLEDIHQRGGLDADLLERTTEALNNSQWVDE